MNTDRFSVWKNRRKQASLLVICWNVFVSGFSIWRLELEKSWNVTLLQVWRMPSFKSLPVLTSILATFCNPVFLHNKNVLLQCLINDILWLVIEFFYFDVITVWRWGVRFYCCDVERDFPQADGDEPAGDWATFHDSVHDVPLNKKTNAMLVFILFSNPDIIPGG